MPIKRVGVKNKNNFLTKKLLRLALWFIISLFIDPVIGPP